MRIEFKCESGVEYIDNYNQMAYGNHDDFQDEVLERKDSIKNTFHGEVGSVFWCFPTRMGWHEGIETSHHTNFCRWKSQVLFGSTTKIST